MSERVWIDRYIRPLATAKGAAGLRDDVATLSGVAGQIITLDTLVEGRHFLSGDPLQTVGQKLVRVNVSDIVAKGASPSEAMLSISWTDGRPEADFAALMEGIGRDFTRFGIRLLGGDFTSTDGPLTLSLTLTGSCFSDGPIMRIGDVRPGCRLWVTGLIGASWLGLQAAQRGEVSGVWIENYRIPDIPGSAVAHYVAKHGIVATDVSDGLLLDAWHLARDNGVGLELDLGAVPLADPKADLAGVLAQVTEGDDFQVLLGTAPEVSPGPEFTLIGTFTTGAALQLIWKGDPVNVPETLGFEH